uniref:DNA topoisomerase (ATP-hydrolyzing) n=1 Tax=Eptatretus burgeri TaxID=7764 RepID=A0A8C4X243_EPTBU
MFCAENKPKRELIKMLLDCGYDPDPLKEWKDSQNKSMDGDDEVETEEGSSDVEDNQAPKARSSEPDFNYILGMPLWCLTKERIEDLIKQRDAKNQELNDIKNKPIIDMWKEDLAALVQELDRVDAQENQEDMLPLKGKTKLVGKAKRRPGQLPEICPSPHGRRVMPRIPDIKELAIKKRTKAIKCKDEFDMDVQPEDEEIEPLNLAQRLKIKNKEKPKQASKKQTSAKPSFKPVRKSYAWLDSGSDEDDLPMLSESDLSDASLQVAPRENKPRRAAAAVSKKYNLDDSEEEEEEDQKGEDEDFDCDEPMAEDDGNSDTSVEFQSLKVTSKVKATKSKETASAVVKAKAAPQGSTTTAQAKKDEESADDVMSSSGSGSDNALALKCPASDSGSDVLAEIEKTSKTKRVALAGKPPRVAAKQTAAKDKVPLKKAAASAPSRVLAVDSDEEDLQKPAKKSQAARSEKKMPVAAKKGMRWHLAGRSGSGPILLALPMFVTSSFV